MRTLEVDSMKYCCVLQRVDDTASIFQSRHRVERLECSKRHSVLKTHVQIDPTTRLVLANNKNWTTKQTRLVVRLLQSANWQRQQNQLLMLCRGLDLNGVWDPRRWNMISIWMRMIWMWFFWCLFDHLCACSVLSIIISASQIIWTTAGVKTEKVLKKWNSGTNQRTHS